jgi:outer membrane autotransporter protein
MSSVIRVRNMVSQKFVRRGLLAGTSLIALSLYSDPVLASCISASSGTTTVSDSRQCAFWTGGDLQITNTGSFSGASTAIDVAGHVGALTNNGTISANSAAISYSGATGTDLTNNGTINSNIQFFNGTLTSLSNTGAINNGSIQIMNGIVTSVSNGGTITNGSIQFGTFGNGSGTLGTLTNSGTISGGGIQITNPGSGTVVVTTLTNSGTVDNILVQNTGAGTTSVTTLTNTGTVNNGIVNFAGNGGGAAGTIGTLTNGGTINNAGVGIANGGLISVLSNTGTIAVTVGAAISNNATVNLNTTNGTIGALTNSGTISSPTAIFNPTGATLGTVTNTGMIAGNIINQATQNLTIAGGSGAVYGTLTGSSGGLGSADQGTITNTASNLIFASGNLLLNDAINVGSHAIMNNGATLKLVNAIAITGAYQQSGGGIVAQAASANSYGHLTVSGIATVANASIVISGSSLAAGNSFTVVHSAVTGSYAGDTASVIGTNGLTASLQAVGNDLVVTLAAAPGGTSTPFTPIGTATGGVATALGPVLDQINGGNSPTAVAFQNTVLTPLALLPASQQGQAIQQLAPVQSSFQTVDGGATAILGAVEQHQQTAMGFNPATGVAAGSGTRPGTLWGQALGGGAQRGSNAQAAGYNSTDAGLAAGFDHLFTPELLGGVAVSWLRAWSHGIDGASGQTSTLNSYQVTLYGTWRHGRAFVDGQLGAGWNHFDQSRAIAFLGQTASSGYDGQQYVADALAGFDLPVGGPGELTVTPLAGLRWLRADNGSYRETGAGAANLSVAGQTIDSVTQVLGAKGSWRIATALGTLTPELTAEWVHDYTQSAIPTSAVIGGQALAVTTTRIAADGARIGAAAELVSSDTVSFRAEYDGELRPGYQSHTGLVKVLFHF